MKYIIGIKILLVLMLIPVSSYSAFYEKCYGYTSYKNRYYPCYSHGNCTWWAAYKRPDLKAFSLGDAGSWYNNSLPHGYHVGNKPAVGAVAVFNNDGYGHVAYVENVYDDGSFQVTEMDYFGSFGDGMSLARYYPENGHYRRLPNGEKYPEGLQGTKWNVTGFIYYRDCMFITEDIGVVCWDHEDGDFYWPEDAFYFSLYKYDKKTKSYTEEFLKGGEGRSYFDKIAENPSDYSDAKLIDLGVYLAKGKAEDGNVLGIGGIGGPGYPTFPIDSAASGKLPDFITDKVTMGNKSGNKEKYIWQINESAYVHSWTDNIGDADWEGDAEKIKVAFFLSKGKKEDRHSEWERVGREKIKKRNLKVKKKPKHEKIKFNLAEWANASKVLPGRTYNFVVCADRPKDEGNKDGDVKEKHKSNNCSTEAIFYVDFGPARDVDLITGNLALTNGLTELQADQKYGLQVEVSNHTQTTN
ncbi:MAG: CHAP domain-containing protein [Candidatus Electrothrix sp. ATG1]|nr:CHAP domain-containing protein [Candidatus Electrothrix sp. ATG1]